MAYKSSIPLATDRLKISQSDIFDNFQAISTFVAANHGTFGAVDEGKHKFLQMPEQVGVVTTAANEAGLYSKVGVVSLVSELVFKRESNGSEIFFTEGLLTADEDDPGWARLANGSLVKWGVTSAAPAAANDAGTPTYTVTFPVGANIPAFATNPMIFTEHINGAVPGAGFVPNLIFIRTGVSDTLGFDISKAATAGAIEINFLAIGT